MTEYETAEHVETAWELNDRAVAGLFKFCLDNPSQWVKSPDRELRFRKYYDTVDAIGLYGSTVWGGLCYSVKIDTHGDAWFKYEHDATVRSWLAAEKRHIEREVDRRLPSPKRSSPAPQGRSWYGRAKRW